VKPTYPNFEQAAKACKYGKAVSRLRIMHKDRVITTDLVKPLYGDGYLYYEGTGVVIRKATAAEIDRQKKWWTYS